VLQKGEPVVEMVEDVVVEARLVRCRDGDDGRSDHDRGHDRLDLAEVLQRRADKSERYEEAEKVRERLEGLRLEAGGVDRLRVRCLRRQRSARQHEKGFSVARRLDAQASNERRDEKHSKKQQDEEAIGLEFEGKIHRKSVSL